MNFLTADEDGCAHAHIYDGEDREVKGVLEEALRISKNADKEQGCSINRTRRLFILYVVLNYVNARYFEHPDDASRWEEGGDEIKEIMPDFPFDWDAEKWKPFRMIRNCDYEQFTGTTHVYRSWS